MAGNLHVACKIPGVDVSLVTHKPMLHAGKHKLQPPGLSTLPRQTHHIWSREFPLACPPSPAKVSRHQIMLQLQLPGLSASPGHSSTIKGKKVHGSLAGSKA